MQSKSIKFHFNSFSDCLYGCKQIQRRIVKANIFSRRLKGFYFKFNNAGWENLYNCFLIVLKCIYLELIAHVSITYLNLFVLLVFKMLLQSLLLAGIDTVATHNAIYKRLHFLPSIKRNWTLFNNTNMSTTISSAALNHVNGLIRALTKFYIPLLIQHSWYKWPIDIYSFSNLLVSFKSSHE